MVESGIRKGVATTGFSDRDLESVFELLERVARAAVATLGAECEVVVHDLRNPEHSVVAISGDLTGRKVGAPVPDPELLPGVVDAKVEDELRRTATTPSGRELISSTVWIRDLRGHTVGALCINADFSDLRRARDLIQRHVGTDVPGAPPLPTFASSLGEFVRTAVDAALADGARQDRLRKVERSRVVRQLYAQGVFALRGSVDAVAAELGVSRASIYADLKDLQEDRGNSSSPATSLSFRPAAVAPVNAAAPRISTGR